MKVQYSDNPTYYDNLFQSLLTYCNGLTEEDKNKLGAIPAEITNLPKYYEWLSKIRSEGLVNYELLRIPAEEQYFDIDLNARTIKIPAAFVKNGLGVQGDKAAEIVYFRCARYFDEMDLALCKNNGDDVDLQGACWIQWKRPGDVEPHLSLAYAFDISEDELIFGWVLGDESTKIAGDLEFSVRFVQWDRNDTSVLTYSFSTLTTRCSIKPSLSLQYTADPIMVSDELNQLVATRPIYAGVINSTFGALPIIITGENLPTSANLDDTGVATLRVKAQSPDNGTLSIRWYEDVLGDADAEVAITDLDRFSESKDDASGVYTFELRAEAAGQYKGIISNETEKGTRALNTNVCNIPGASDFAFNATPGTEDLVFADGANKLVIMVDENTANGAEVEPNQYNGVSYQWYLKPANFDGETYRDAAPIVGATGNEYTLATTDDGLVYCVITNKRNNSEKAKESDSWTVRPNPVAPQVGDITRNEEDGSYYVDMSGEPDLRNITYLWYDKYLTRASTSEIYAPWVEHPDLYAPGDGFNVTCDVIRSYNNKQITVTRTHQVIVPQTI